MDGLSAGLSNFIAGLLASLLESVHWDVRASFRQGSKDADSVRNMCCEPLPVIRMKLRLVDSQILKIEGSVCSLRAAPRNWWKFLTFSIVSQGWREHQLDQCFYLVNVGEELVGILGIYDHDCLICENDLNRRSQHTFEALRKLWHQVPAHLRLQHPS